jgi:phage baseplate assembly protein W
VENDIQFDASGNIITLENGDLLVQSALKIILTVQGSNPYHRWYGSLLRSRIGSNATGSTAALIREDVMGALTTFRDMQSQISRAQVVTPEERLASVQQVNVNPIEGLPTAFLVNVVMKSASSRRVEINTVFTVPGVIPLGRLNNG